jgi:DnaD/phage-associated family protein
MNGKERFNPGGATMADYWMKLYIEILQDPKMATLPDRIWRRIIELFLVAKSYGNDGHLPDIQQIAWILRMKPGDLEKDMAKIVPTGIIIRDGTGFFIPKFEARQSAVPDRDRKAQERIRKQSRRYDGYVTELSRNVTQINRNRLTETETETETKTEAENPVVVVVPSEPDGDLVDVPTGPNAYELYENEIGTLTPTIADLIQSAETDYSSTWVEDAIKAASIANIRKWSYITGILQNWKTDGRDNGNGKKGKPALDELTPEQRAARYAGGEYADFVQH